MKKHVKVEIEANGRFCSNDCRFMSADAKRCELYSLGLVWDYKKKTNGNIRLRLCREAEIR